jgi:hypothetical protein
MSQLAARLPAAVDRLDVPVPILMTTGPQEWGCIPACDHKQSFRNHQGSSAGPSAYVAWPILEWKASRPSPPVEILLGEFLRLAMADDEAILQFARTWGPLIVDSHISSEAVVLRRPQQNETASVLCPTPFMAVCTRSDGRQDKGQLYRLMRRQDLVSARMAFQSIEHWRRYSRLFDAILRMCSHQSNGRGSKGGGLEVLREFAQEPYAFPRSYSILSSRKDMFFDHQLILGRHKDGLSNEILRLVMNQLMASAVFCGLAPRFHWNDQVAALFLHLELVPRSSAPTYAGLLPALVSELYRMLHWSFGVYECDGCGAPYNPPSRRPRRGMSFYYCPACGGGGSLAAKRAYNRRQGARRAVATADSGPSTISVNEMRSP